MYNNVIRNLNGSYTYDKNGLPYNVPSTGEWVEEYNALHAWALENPELITVEEDIPPPPPPTLSEQASRISLTKREFLKIMIALTADMVHPVTGESMAITLSGIETYVAAAPDQIRLEWDYANYIERSHPALDAVANDFGVTAEMLDIVFVNAQDFLYKIDNNLPLHEAP